MSSSFLKFVWKGIEVQPPFGIITNISVYFKWLIRERLFTESYIKDMAKPKMENKTIFIQQGKGSKDRYIPISSRLHVYLSEYLKDRGRLKV